MSGPALPYTMQDLFRMMAQREAIDLFVKPGVQPMFRLASGGLHAFGFAAPSPEATEALAAQVMSDENRADLEQSGHTDLAYWEPSLGRFRLNVYLQRGTVALVARRVIREIPSFETLRLPPVVGEFARAPRGLVLVTGPAGSGKSTTLAAMTDYRNRTVSGHIITIEDPIEYLHEDRLSFISQREVGTDTETFASGLRSALRQTPDVLVIGEMRDVDSATSAVYFAETGHLVLSTLHTINVAQCLDRVLHFFPPETHEEVKLRLSTTLVGIVGQRLVPQADGKGLVLGVEVMRSTPRVRELLRRGDYLLIKEAMAEGGDVGMQTFDASLFGLYQQGLISAETALEAAESPNDLRLRLRGFAPIGRRQG